MQIFKVIFSLLLFLISTLANAYELGNIMSKDQNANVRVAAIATVGISFTDDNGDAHNCSGVIIDTSEENNAEGRNDRRPRRILTTDACLSRGIETALPLKVINKPSTGLTPFTLNIPGSSYTVTRIAQLTSEHSFYVITPTGSLGHNILNANENKFPQYVKPSTALNHTDRGTPFPQYTDQNRNGYPVAYGSQ